MANMVIGITGLVVCLLGLVQILKARFLDKRMRTFLVTLFAILTAYVLANLITQLAEGNPGNGWVFAHRIALFFESLFSALLIPLLTDLLLYTCGDADRKKNPILRTSACLLGLYTAILLYTQFTRTIYYIDELNIYHRGPWYPVLLVPPVLMMALNLALLLNRRKELSRRQRKAFAAYFLIPAAVMVLQMAFYGIYVIVAGTVIAAYIMLAYLMDDQTDQVIRQEAEISSLKNEIMLSQIQPHFMINTLGAIAHLCKDAPEAKEAIQTFSRYLRGNIEVLSRETMIPFEQELEHTRMYLELENLRFGDSLTILWDLKCTDFMIPTLTLQPMAENAVRHGVRGNPDGKGTVCIASREFADRYEVSITDDGPGFSLETEKNDGRIHVGISNVRERLKTICGGELSIETGPGKGTCATIRLPKE